MAAADASQWPVKGQAFRLSGFIFNRTTSRVFEGLGTLTAEISKDGGNWAATTSTPVEVDSGGLVRLDLTATEMNANTVAVKIQSDDENSTQIVWCDCPIDLSEPTGHFRAAAVLRLEQILSMLGVRFQNKADRRFSDGRLRRYAYGGGSVLATETFNPDSTEEHEVRAEAS